MTTLVLADSQGKYFDNLLEEHNILTPFKKLPHSKEFQKTVSYIKEYPFLQVIEYIGNEAVYKPRPHGNTKDNSASEFCRTAPSVINKMNNELKCGKSVSNTYTKLVRECNEPKVQGILNPRNRQQVKNV